jgi:putative peptide zinc metalloprotease protein
MIQPGSFNYFENTTNLLEGIKLMRKDENRASDKLKLDPLMIPKLVNIRRISELHTSFSEQNYVVITTFGTNFRITKSLYTILCHINGYRTIKDVVSLIRKHDDLDINSETLWEFFVTELVPRELISFEDMENVAVFEKFSTKSPFRITIMSRRFQLVISHLLERFVAFPLLILFISSFYILIFIFNRPLNNIHLSSVGLLFTTILLIVGIFIHELGHSAAGVRNGIQPGTIAIRFFLWFPVFSIDVNDAWILNRKSRIELDLGGMGLQSAYGIFLLLSSILFQSLILYQAAILNFSTVFLNAIPFPRFDGYWVLTDALGVPNLRQKALKEFKRFFTKKKLEIEPWEQTSAFTKAALFGYGIFIIISAFTVGIFFYSFFMSFITLMISLPSFIIQIHQVFLNGNFFDFLIILINIIILILFFLGFIYFFIVTVTKTGLLLGSNVLKLMIKKEKNMNSIRH